MILMVWVHLLFFFFFFARLAQFIVHICLVSMETFYATDYLPGFACTTSLTMVDCVGGGGDKRDKVCTTCVYVCKFHASRMHT